jgi:hypothetical protein
MNIMSSALKADCDSTKVLSIIVIKLSFYY